MKYQNALFKNEIKLELKNQRHAGFLIHNTNGVGLSKLETHT